MKRLIITGLAALGFAGAQPALADVDIDIAVGVPGIVYSTPHPPRYGHHHRHYEPNGWSVTVGQPQVVVVPGSVVYNDYPRYYKRHDYHPHKKWRGHKGKRHHKHRGYRD